MTTPSDFPLHGCDISEFQAQHLVPQMIDFAVVRATYGARKDKRTAEHCEALRKRQACTVGIYHFFIPNRLDAQFDAFGEQAEAVGLGTGDLIPWVDVEDTSGRGTNGPRPEWCEPLQELLLGFRERWGRVGVYITKRDWAMLGSPEWMLDYPLWVAHWRTTPGEPASPGDVRPSIWQYRVGPWSPRRLHEIGGHTHPRAIDHDCAVTLPVLAEYTVPVQRTKLLAWDPDWGEMASERDDAVRGR